MKNLGVAMVGGHGRREKDDFYPTPPEATEALLTLIKPRRVWEPACGDGAISKVLKCHGIDVVSTDLVDRGYGEGGVDFLEAEYLFAPAIVTNPPFKHAEAFARHAIALGADTVALLLKATFWNAAIRFPLFAQHPPEVVAPLMWRLDFTGGGAPTMDCAWAIWSIREGRDTTFIPLLKPKPRIPGTEDWPDDLVALI